MILPFTRAHQATEADRLLAEVRAGNAPVVHVTDFPRLGINHGLLLYDVVDGVSSPTAARPFCFLAYDPNDPNRPVTVTFDTVRRTFVLPPLPYYHGGPVNLYEVYGSALR